MEPLNIFTLETWCSLEVYSDLFYCFALYKISLLPCTLCGSSFKFLEYKNRETPRLWPLVTNKPTKPQQSQTQKGKGQTYFSPEWWHGTLIPAPGRLRLRQEDCYEFEASLGHTVKSFQNNQEAMRGQTLCSSYSPCYPQYIVPNKAEALQQPLHSWRTKPSKAPNTKGWPSHCLRNHYIRNKRTPASWKCWPVKVMQYTGI